jgi:hypothetical protein
MLQQKALGFDKYMSTHIHIQNNSNNFNNNLGYIDLFTAVRSHHLINKFISLKISGYYLLFLMKKYVCI